MKVVGHIIGHALWVVALVMGVLVLFGGVDLRHVALAEPLWLVAAIVPVLAVIVRQLWVASPPALRFSRVGSLRRIRGGIAARLVHLPDGLRLAAALLVVVALARPQSTRGSDRVSHDGIDIVVVLDLSESMESPDLPPSRLAAAQAVIDGFIRRRPHDRIGMVVFGSTASTVSPLTVDHEVLRALVSRLRLGVIDGERTAIGAGLGVALNRLDESSASSRVVVLLTDGVHNAGGLDPDSVAEAAADRGVKVYTVLMGQHARGRDASVDPARLERIASMTGGYAYTAADPAALQGSFQDLLDKLERSSIEGEHVRPELFEWLLWPALLVLMLEVVLRSTRLRRFP